LRAAAFTISGRGPLSRKNAAAQKLITSRLNAGRNCRDDELCIF
jgi:hypothetical protein